MRYALPEVFIRCVLQPGLLLQKFIDVKHESVNGLICICSHTVGQLDPQPNIFTAVSVSAAVQDALNNVS